MKSSTGERGATITSDMKRRPTEPDWNAVRGTKPMEARSGRPSADSMSAQLRGSKI